jgi:hypothetical protein
MARQRDRGGELTADAGKDAALHQLYAISSMCDPKSMVPGFSFSISGLEQGHRPFVNVAANNARSERHNREERSHETS